MPADSVARIFALSALEAGQTDKNITVAEKIGGIEAGTVYPEGTSLSQIINDLLGNAPSKKVKIYFGATDNEPNDLSGLDKIEVESRSLIAESGYTIHINSGNIETEMGQYPVVAIPEGYLLTKWFVPGFEFDIPHTLVKGEGYNIYYLNDVSYDRDIGGIDYIVKVQEG